MAGMKVTVPPESTEGRVRVAAQLAAARRELAASAAAGRAGRAAQSRFSDRMDVLVRDVVGAAQTTATPSFAVAALGGYGRRTMCLHSDVDLLIVFEGPIGRTEERFVKDVLHPLWDLRLTVGQQVRTLDERAEAGLENPEFLLAMSDARLLAGDARVFERARRALGPEGQTGREELLEALLRLTDDRYDGFNGTIYQLEPDVKESPGGLRDVSAVGWLAGLAEVPQAADVDADHRLEAASEFLLRLRAIVHLECQRNVNRLTHELQELAADRLKYQGGAIGQRVEALMADYFRHARVVQRALLRARRAAGPAGSDTTRVTLTRDLELTAEGVAFADERRAAAAPSTWLDLFEAALDHGAPVADSALALIERHAPFVDTRSCIPTPEHRRRLLAWLRPRRGLYARLSEMHDCGLLDTPVPGVQGDLVSRDARLLPQVHGRRAHAADHHGIEALLTADGSPRGRFGALLSELPAPELLVLALLFHDVGKWKEDDHAAESVRMAEIAFDRFDLGPEARQTVTFLIAEHLAMSQVAFRRDSEDPGVVRRFAALVGTEERLKMLCLMTLVDVEAVAPGTLTPWREELLWRLYVDTYNQLTLEYGDHLIAEGQGAMARCSGTAGRHRRGRAQALPRRIPAAVPGALRRSHVYQHARLARDIRPDEVHLFLERKEQVWELAVVTLDKPFLFSNICGVLSYFGMDILRGTAMTSPTGLVLDIFQFADRESFLALNEDAPRRLERVLQDVVGGCEDVTRLLRRKEAGLRSGRAPAGVSPWCTSPTSTRSATRSSRSSRRTRRGSCTASAA